MEQARTFYDTILKSSHPLLVSVHLAGKAAPIVFYLLGSLLGLSFTAQFILVLLLLAFDFYVTKNISGRRLVQLRWWYDVSADNTRTFKFESHKEYDDNGISINPIDSKLFWWSMYLTPAIWAVFLILCVLQLKLFYMVLVMLALGLTGWNTYGFRSCYRWEPNANDAGEPWFQMPSIPAFDNWQLVNRVTTLFNRS